MDKYIVVIIDDNGTIGLPVSPELEESYTTYEKAERAAKRLRKNSNYSWIGATLAVKQRKDTPFVKIRKERARYDRALQK